MKKLVLIILLFTIILVLNSLLPIYQGLAYRGKVPMLSDDYATWPNTFPVNNEINDDQYQAVSISALEALKVQRQTVHAPGYTAAAAVDGKLVWSASVGWADLANRQPMTTDTQLRIGSTSKALTATGLAVLVANGQLGLDTPISNYLPSPKNPKWENITARQLASHMSGMPHYKENTEFLGVLKTLSAQGYYSDVLDAIELFDESDLLFEPGEQFSYSSLGTVLLSAVMQQSSNIKYQKLMHESVFKPLNMNSTLANSPEYESERIAEFYWQNEQQPEQILPWYDLNLSHRLAGGGWLSTSKDLVKLGQGFINDDFIPTNVKNEFWTPQVLNNGKVNSQNYGLGWRIHQLNIEGKEQAITYMHHGGVSAGAQSFLLVIPEYKLSIAINANIRTAVFSDFSKVTSKLVRLFIAELDKQAQRKKEADL